MGYLYSSSVSFRRRPQRSRASLWFGLLGLLFLAVAAGGPVAVAYRVAHPAREALSLTPQALNLEHQEMRIPAADGGAEIAGWWIPAAGSEIAVVMVHDYGRNRLQGGVALPMAKALVRSGFSVFLFDQRGHGASPPGSSFGFGRREAADIGRVVGHLKAAAPAAAHHVVLMAWATGADIALRAAAERQDLSALVLEGSSASPRERLDLAVAEISPYPAFFFGTLTRLMAVLFFAVRPAPLSTTEEQQVLSLRPVLLIEREAGHGERLLNLSGRPGNQLFLVPGAADGRAYSHDPDGYATMVVQFLKQAFPEAR